MTLAHYTLVGIQKVSFPSLPLNKTGVTVSNQIQLLIIFRM